MRAGLVAEFDSPEGLVRALEVLVERGYRELEAYTPFPVEGVDVVLGLRRSWLPRLGGLGALTGVVLAYAIQAWTNAVDYPIEVGGRPAHAPPSFVPITFETGILLCALATFVGLFAVCRLPRLWDPVLEAPGFGRATDDRFFVAVGQDDPRFDPVATREDLTEAGALAIEAYGGGRPMTARVPALVVALAFGLGCEVAVEELDLERMIDQARYEPYEACPLFEDGRAMRPLPVGVVVAERAGPAKRPDESPLPVDRETLERGRGRFEIFCAACHGLRGDGQSFVARSMTLRRPPSLIDEAARQMNDRRVFRAVSQGYGLMPSYAQELAVDERWAVVAYVRALQLSQSVPLDRLPAELRREATEALP